MSRMLGEVDCQSLERMREMNHFVCLSRLQEEGIKRITLDLDGSVQSTSRHAEGTAVGFNKKKKGERSYYPLLATISQTGQISRLTFIEVATSMTPMAQWSSSVPAWRRFARCCL